RPAATNRGPHPAPRRLVPQPAPQPAPRPAAPQPAPQPKKPAKKSNKTLLICLLSVVVLAGIGAALWFFVFDKKDEPKTELAESAPAAQAQPAPAPEPAPATAPEPEPEPEPEPVVEEAVEEPMKGTQEPPTDADFSNWYIGKAQVKGMPRGAATLSTLDDVQGGWKALFFQDPKNKYGVKAYTLANVVIAGTGNDLTFTIKRHSTRFLTSNEKIDEEKELDDVFSARWNNGKLNASGAGSLTLTSFWEQDGKQYAIGTFDSPDGIPVSLGMVRPQ
ncbi:MAG: hypothetical protein KBT39_11090, partial [Bacteroidales bacterium]|nr:hypothetical protein [Bacteroidales bacterium]